MRPQLLINDNVVHQVAESELALKRPLAEALVGPPQDPSGRLAVEP